MKNCTMLCGKNLRFSHSHSPGKGKSSSLTEFAALYTWEIVNTAIKLAACDTATVKCHVGSNLPRPSKGLLYKNDVFLRIVITADLGYWISKYQGKWFLKGKWHDEHVLSGKVFHITCCQALLNIFSKNLKVW